MKFQSRYIRETIIRNYKSGQENLLLFRCSLSTAWSVYLQELESNPYLQQNYQTHPSSDFSHSNEHWLQKHQRKTWYIWRHDSWRKGWDSRIRMTYWVCKQVKCSIKEGERERERRQMRINSLRVFLNVYLGKDIRTEEL